MKKIYSFVLIFTMVMGMFSIKVMAQDNINVIVNGENVDFSGDQAPIIQNGRTMVPLRVLSESIGAKVDWENSSRTVTITTPDVLAKSPEMASENGEYTINNYSVSKKVEDGTNYINAYV